MNLKRVFGALLVSVLSVGALTACEVAPAERPEPDPAAFFTVNTLPYAYTVLEPAEQALRIVAEERGWSQADIEAWVPFLVYDVIAKESGGCYNVRGGAKMAEPGVSCVIRRQGKGGDSGFGQVIGMHYRGWMCEQERLCSSADITLNAWNSMTALLALVERSGKQGWCWNAWARSFHSGCKHAPGAPPIPQR